MSCPSFSPRPRRRRARPLAPGLLLALALALLTPAILLAHNLQTKMAYVFFDKATQDLLDARINGPGWTPPQPLLQVGDELGIIIKGVPRDGTNTGVGGYLDFYVPNGTTVLDAGYVVPDGSGGHVEVPMKGQSPIATGSGSIGAKVSPPLIGLNLGPNINGITEAVVNAGGLARGTIAGLYADTGIFYSSSPETAYDTWVKRGGYDGSTGTSDNTLTNNSGDVIVPLNKWDAEQLLAYGAKSPITAIVDTVDQRGNAPWGLANGVAGPQSGYAWEFDWDTWTATGDMKNAADGVGPWQRIQYPGSQISKDQAGLSGTTLGYVGVDASGVGFALSPGSPLPATVSQTDGVSPKTIRWSLGQTKLNHPEYAWVKIRVNDTSAILQPDGCPYFYAGAFGGDAGGSDNGKDHLWRYYEPSRVTLNGCLALGKPADRAAVKPGDIFSYKVKLYNAGNVDHTNLIVKDTLPAGVQFISAVPAQNAGPNPLVWNVGNFPRGAKFEATITVKATASGSLENTVTATTDQGSTTGTEITPSGSIPILVQNKSVSPTTVAPGGTVQYTLDVWNLGSGPSGNPILIKELLPSGLTYVSKDQVLLNGADLTAATTVNSGNPAQPVFSIPGALNAGQHLYLKFTALVSAQAAPGQYCNSYELTQGGIPQASGLLACVTVGGARIGDTVFRDWNGDGTQDAEDEGLPNVTVNLHAGACPPSGGPVQTKTTDAGGQYLFAGLTAGTYCVDAPAPGAGGVPAAYSLTTGNDPRQVTLVDGQQVLDADFGYLPGGPGSIGDTVFEDLANNGLFDGADLPIDDVDVSLYEDTNGNGILDAGQDALIGTATTSGGGLYDFTGLDVSRNYLVAVDDGPASAVDLHFSNPYLSSTGNPQAVSPADFTAQADAVTDADFGYFGQTPGSIGDTVCRDTDGDKLCDPGEPGIANVTVTLYLDSDGDGVPDVLVATTATDVNGVYSFPDLGPSDYVVQVDGDDPDLPVGYVALIDEVSVALAPGQDVTDADFPFAPLILKTVDKASANPGDTLTYTVQLNSQTSALLESVRVIDSIPAGSTYVAASANMGGSFGAFSSSPGEPGYDEGPPGLGTSLSVSPTNTALGGSINVSMVLTSTLAIASVTPDPLVVNGGEATCSAPVPAIANVPAAPGSAVFSFNCVMTSLGEFSFTGSASGGGGEVWPEGTSNSALVTQSGSTSVVTWNLGSNEPGVPGVVITSGSLPGIYGFQGAKKNPFRRYETSLNTWTSKANALNNIGPGGALAYDGTDIYGLRGDGQKTFYRYSIATNSWVTRANTSDKVGEGGALTYLNVGGTDYLFALLGNSNRFRRYNIAANSWSNMANTPASVKKGGALTTDGTYIYALQGDRKKGFWRYDPAANSWSAMAPVPANVGWGGALTHLGSYIYALRGDGQKSFYRYDIAGNTWTARANTLGNVAEGGALVNDGTYLYATQGKTTAFWRYDPAMNVWAVLAPVAANTGQGGALVFVPGTGSADRTAQLSTSRTMVNHGETVVLTMELVSNANIATVTPGTVSTTVTGGASATCGAASPASQAMTADVPATFTWTCTLSTGSLPGTVAFSAGATGTGGADFDAATSNTVIAIKPLSFQVTVNNPASVSIVQNVAAVSDDSGTIPTTPSNITMTPLGASIGDLVWADLDGDGTQDPGEPGIAGVQVNVTGPGCAPCSAVTDVFGAYLVGGLAAGSYNAAVAPGTVPPGHLLTTPGSVNATLSAGQQFTTADFGLRPPGTASIGDTVWLDTDEDGVQDAGEPGIPGITVRLYIDQNNDGAVDIGDTLVTVDITDADGRYGFGGLHPDDYLVAVDEAGTVTSPYDNAVTTTLAAGLDPTTGTANPRDVTVTSVGQVIDDADFGYAWAGSIGDFAWYDFDGDGLQDGGAETGAPNVNIVLYYDVDGDGAFSPADTVVAAQETDASGSYLFAGMPPGDYLVKAEEQQVPAPPSSPHAGQIGFMVTTNGSKRSVALAPGQDYLDADFGFVEGAELEGHVFHDVNRNGVLDPGEPLLPGIEVTLTGTDVNLSPVSLSTVTDPAGEYAFVVLPGSYTIAYSPPDVLAIDPGLVTATTPTSLVVNPLAGQEIYNLDFGVDHAGVVGDRVWNDGDGDGVQDPEEAGLAGVTVNLYADNDNSGTVSAGDSLLAVDVTDSSGLYRFSGLDDGEYVVRVSVVSLPVDFAQTYDNNAPLDNTGEATVAGGGADLQADFGYRYSPFGGASLFTIGGRVYDDQNDNGNDDGEPGFPNVDVQVVCNFATFVVPTDATGAWAISGIPDGSTCTVLNADETDLPSGAYVGTEAPTPPITVNTDLPGLDFGYNLQPGSISGSVCDGDGDGLCEPGETPLSPVTVTLRFAGPDGILNTVDDTVQVDVTDGNGDYGFVGLPPGLYQITETNPPGVTSVADADGGNPDNISQVLALDEDLVDQDFEDSLPGALSVGDRVFFDLDNDGLFEPGAGEFGMDGVAVNLYADDGDGVLDAGDTLLNSSSTGGGGHFLFGGLAAGSFLLELDPADFLPGEVLEGLESSNGNDVAGQAPDPDNDLDHDDNGSLTPGFGIATKAFTLGSGTEPGPAVDGDGTDSNRTVDFGLRRLESPTGVLLTGFQAERVASNVLLRWSTLSETGVAGFEIHRSASPDGEFRKLGEGMIPSRDAQAGANYRFTDEQALSGQAWYRLVLVTEEGRRFSYGPLFVGPRLGSVGLRLYLPLVSPR